MDKSGNGFWKALPLDALNAVLLNYSRNWENFKIRRCQDSTPDQWRQNPCWGIMKHLFFNFPDDSIEYLWNSLLYARHHTKDFAFGISIHLHKNLFIKEENRGTEKLSKSPKATQIVAERDLGSSSKILLLTIPTDGFSRHTEGVI